MRCKPIARRGDHRAKLGAVALSALDVGRELRDLGRWAPRGFRGQPACDALLFDGHGKRLVERRVVLHVDDLVRELVEDEARELRFAIADERRQHRVVEIAERRVGGHAAQVDVVAGRGEPRRFGARVVFGEVAAVGDASGDRKAPLPRRQRQLRRGEHVPQHERPTEVGVARVAAIVGQRELAATRTRGSPARARAAP